MICEPVRTKEVMYKLLVAGCFGNTLPQWFDIQTWKNDPKAGNIPVWGVRTLTPGGPCRLYCPRNEVEKTAEEYRQLGHKINISIMLDAICYVTLYADVYDDPTTGQLCVYGVEYPPKGSSWRAIMPTQGKTYTGLEARLLLQRHLTPSSLADGEALRELYPDHVYELSACDRNIGTIPGRNSIMWEVRLY